MDKCRLDNCHLIIFLYVKPMCRISDPYPSSRFSYFFFVLVLLLLVVVVTGVKQSQLLYLSLGLGLEFDKSVKWRGSPSV